MPYVCPHPEAYAGQVVGNGQCVRFVQIAAQPPITSEWTEGVRVRGATVAAGTVIATFVNGTYSNHPTGNHAAIYAGQDTTGLFVWDQWTGHPVSKRHIAFKNPPTLDPSNNGNAFSVVK